MNINATLFVQIGNFFIAYFLFRHILLRPGYQALCEKESHQSSLEDMVSQGKEVVQKGRQDQKDAWAAFHGWCKEYFPSAADRMTVFRGISIPIAPKKLSDSQKKNARIQLSDTMISMLKERYER